MTGNDSAIASTQLISPMAVPSTMTTPITAPFEAPIARSTPISRVRSSTFMLIMPVSPSTPTSGDQGRHHQQEIDDHIEGAPLLRQPVFAHLNHGGLQALPAEGLFQGLGGPPLGGHAAVHRGHLQHGGQPGSGMYLSRLS